MSQLATRRLQAVLFVGLVAWIVIAADVGWCAPMFQFVDRVPRSDKVMHVVFLGGLSFFVNRALSLGTVSIGGWTVLTGSFLLTLLATTEEFSQYFLPRRSFDLMDLACNYAGIFGFGMLATRIESRRQPRSGDSGTSDNH